MKTTTLTIAVIAIASLALTTHASQSANCLLTQELSKSSVARIKYMVHVSKLNQPQKDNNPAEMYGNVVEASFNAEDQQLDEMSFECLSCHDGLAAKTYDVRIKNNPMNRVVDINTIKGSHPIGMDYNMYSRVNEQLRKVSELNSNMIFIKGRVGCLTCHNPLNPEGNHLVMNNTGSALCLTCHNK